MPEARDLVLARLVLKYRKAPKVAIAEALKAVERKRAEGLDTSLAKVLVERGWLAVSDLREIVGKARGEAYYCRRCAGRFALPTNPDGSAPKCPRCNVPLIDASRSPPQSARWVRPTLKAQAPPPSAINNRPASLRTGALPWPGAPQGGPPAPAPPPRQPPPLELSPPSDKSSDDGYDPSSWPSAPPQAVRSGASGIQPPPPRPRAPNAPSSEESMTFDAAELAAARDRARMRLPLEPSTDHQEPVEFDPVQDDEEALERLQNTMIVEPVPAAEQRAASGSGAMDFDSDEEDDEPHVKTGAYAPVPVAEQLAASSSGDFVEVPDDELAEAIAEINPPAPPPPPPAPAARPVPLSSSADVEPLPMSVVGPASDDDGYVGVRYENDPRLDSGEWAKRNLSALSPEEQEALSGRKPGDFKAWWEGKTIDPSEWGETADLVVESNDGGKPDPRGTARLPGAPPDPWQRLARGDAPTVELPPIEDAPADPDTRSMPAAREQGNPFQPIRPEELEAIGRTEDDRAPTDLAAFPFPSVQAPAEDEQASDDFTASDITASDVDRALASDDDLARDSLDPDIDVSGRLEPARAGARAAAADDGYSDEDVAEPSDIDDGAFASDPSGDPEELRDPLTGKVIEGSGRFILELTTWDNVTEFLGVDVPALDVTSTSPDMKVISAPDTLAPGAADVALAVKKKKHRRAGKRGLEPAGAPAAGAAVEVVRRGRLRRLLTNPVILLLLLGGGGFAGFAYWRAMVEGQLGEARGRAEAALAAGRVEQARDELTRAIALAPNDIDLRYRRAAIALELGDTALARQDAEHVISLEPEDARAHELRGRALLDAGRLKDAAAAYDKALTFAQRDRRARVTGEMQEGAALAALGAGGGDRAVELAELVLGGEPERPVAAAIAGWIHLERGDAQRALRVMSGARAEGADALELLVVRARASVAAGRPIEATRDLDAALALDATGAVASLLARLRAQARIHAAHPGARPSQAPKQPGEDRPFPPGTGVAEEPGPLLEQALAELGPADAADPGADVAGARAPRGLLRLPPVAERVGAPIGLSVANAGSVLRALALEGLGRSREAVAEILSATEVDPSDGEALALLARMRLREADLFPTRPGPLMLRRDPGSIDDAARAKINASMRDYGNALTKARPPADPGRVQVELGATYLLLGRPGDAKASAEQAIELADRVDARVLAADAALAAGDLGEARKHARRAIQLDAAGASAAKLRLARVHAAESNWAEADRVYGEVLEQAGRPNAILAERGAVRCAAKDFAGGMEDLDAAVEADPTLASAWLSLARARAAPGQDTLERALEAVDRACQEAPSWAQARLLRARLLESGGRLPEAVKAYESVLELEAKNPDALLRRALLADELAEPNASLAAINAAIATLGNTEALFLLRIRALARCDRASDADVAVSELAKLDLTGRLESFGQAIVFVYQYGEDSDRVPWGTVLDRLSDAENAVSQLDPKTGGNEVRALFHDLRALAREATGKPGAGDDRALANQLRLDGRPDPGKS